MIVSRKRTGLSSIVLVVFFLQPFNLHAQEVLGFPEYLSLIKEHDPVSKQLKIQQEKIRFFVEEAKPEDAFQINLEGEYGQGDDDIDTESLSAKLSKKINESGTSFSLSHTAVENTDRDEKVSEFELEQPLLKDGFGKDTRREIDILEKEARIQKLEALEQYEGYIRERISLYFSLAKIQQEYAFLQSMMVDTRNLLQYIQEKNSRGAANQIDLNRARLQLIQREQDLLKTEEQLASVREEITARFRGMKIPVYDEENLQVETDLNLANLFPADVSSFQLGSFRLYQVAELGKEIGIENYELSKRQDLAELSIFGGYKVDDSTRFSTNVNREEASVGVRLSMPINSRKARASKEVYQLESEDRQINLDVQAKYLLSEYNKNRMLLKRLEKELALVGEKLDLIKSVLADQELRYKRGQLSIERLIDTSNEYYQYQSEFNNQLLEYNQAYLDWLAFNDLLLEEQE